MSKVQNIFKGLNTLVLILFSIEFLVLFCEIDLFPILFTGFICGFLIVLNNRKGVFFTDLVSEKDVKHIIFFLIISFLVVSLFVLFLIFGISNISSYILAQLMNNKIFRFFVYGFLFPCFISYLMIWCWSDEKPTHLTYSILGTGSKFVFVNLFIGILICMNWEYYIGLSSSFLRILG